MINNHTVLKFSTLTGCATSKHLKELFGAHDNRQINRVLSRLAASGYLQKSGSIRKESVGKPVPIYTPTNAGFSLAGVKRREVNSLPALTRSVLVSNFVSLNNQVDYAINIEDKNEIFNCFGLRYPHKDKWYAGNLVFRTKEKSHVVVPFTDYQAAVRICKESEKRENKAIYHILISADLFEKVNRLTSKYINPFGIYGQSRNRFEWSELGKKIINSISVEHSEAQKKLALFEIKEVLKHSGESHNESKKLVSNVRISKQDIGFILSSES